MEAIYAGLLYGLIAGFAAFGFVLTAAFLYGVIDLLDKLSDIIIDKQRGNQHGRGRRKGPEQ